MPNTRRSGRQLRLESRKCSAVAGVLMVISSTCPVTSVADMDSLEPDHCTNPAILPSTPSDDFQIVAGGIAQHTRTGLDWQRCAVGQAWSGDTCVGESELMTWQEALAFANAQDGWRLPNVQELASIVEHCRSEPAINRNVFPETRPAGHWSSSPTATSFNSGIRTVQFFGGFGQGTGGSNPAAARLVRDSAAADQQ